MVNALNFDIYLSDLGYFVWNSTWVFFFLTQLTLFLLFDSLTFFTLTRLEQTLHRLIN